MSTTHQPPTATAGTRSTPPPIPTAMSAPTDLETYLFDLQGFVVLPQALSAGEVAELNACLDTIPRLTPGEWYGYVHAHTYGTKDGLNYQQVYEAGEPFERL